MPSEIADLLGIDLTISLYPNDTAGYDISMRRYSLNSLSYNAFHRHLRASLAADLGVNLFGLISPVYTSRKLMMSLEHSLQRTCPPSTRSLSAAFQPGEIPDCPQPPMNLIRSKRRGSGSTSPLAIFWRATPTPSPKFPASRPATPRMDLSPDHTPRGTQSLGSTPKL